MIMHCTFIVILPSDGAEYDKSIVIYIYMYLCVCVCVCVCVHVRVCPFHLR